MPNSDTKNESLCGQEKREIRSQVFLFSQNILIDKLLVKRDHKIKDIIVKYQKPTLQKEPHINTIKG